MFHCIGKHKNKTIITVVFFSCLVLVVLLLSRQFYFAPEKNRVPDTKLKSSISFASLDGFSLEEKYEDKISFSIQAEKAHVRNRKFGFLRVALQKVVEMENVTVLISEPGDDMDNVEIKSDQATMYMDSKNMLFQGNVLCSSTAGDTLKTGKLLWDKKNNKLQTDNEYEFINSTGAINRGKGVESNSALKEINFKNKYKRLPRGELSNHG